MLRKEEIRTKILEKVEEKFFANGFKNVNLDEIAKELGISKRTIYEHFASKTELIEQMLIDKHNRFNKSMDDKFQKILNDKDLWISDEFRIIWKNIADHSSYFTPIVVEDIKRYANNVFTKCPHFGQDHENIFNKIFDIGLQRGFVKPNINRTILFRIMKNSFMNILNYETMKTLPFTAEEVIEQIYEIILTGSLTDTGRDDFFLKTEKNNWYLKIYMVYLMKHNSIKISMISLLFLLIFGINPNKMMAKKLSLDEAIEIAVKNNQQTKMAQMEVEKARFAVKEAYGYALPTVNFSASFASFLEKSKMAFPDFGALIGNATYGVLLEAGKIDSSEAKFRPVTSTLQSFAQTNNYEAKFELQQILFNSAVFQGIGASGTYLKTAQAGLKSQVAKTVLDVKKTYYGVLLAQEMVKLVDASLANFENNVRNVEAFYKEGLVSEYQLLQAQVAMENFRPRVLMARNGYKNAIEGLKLILGAGQEEEIEVEGELVKQDLSQTDKNRLINIAVNENLDLKTLKLKRDVDEAFIELDRSEYWPTLALFGNYSFNGSADDLNFMNYRSGMVGLAFTINLFNGQRTDNKVQQAKINVYKTDEQIIQTKHFIEMSVKSKMLDIERTLNLITANEKNVELAQRAFKIAEIKIKEGTGTQLDILNSEMALREAQVNRLNSIYEYIIAKTELENLTGELNEEYLKLIENK